MQKHTSYVLITGCGEGGIGHALAVEFQRKGAVPFYPSIPFPSANKGYPGYVVFATLLPHEARGHLTQIGITVVNADVTSDEDIRSLRDLISATSGGRLDILVNNAGICYTMTAIDSDVKEVEKMFAVNVFGPIRMVHILHPLLIRARGSIVNIGSVGGIVPYVYGSSYNAAKAALHHWGNTLRVELKPLGVNVVNIISGEIGTNILKRDRGRKLPDASFYHSLAEDFESHVGRTPKTTKPHEYARSVVAEVTKPNPRIWFWTGATSSLVWFGDTFLPRWIWDWLFTREFKLARLSRPQ
ncbi:short chain dehydrogenase [Aspergillus heterothallicus]